MSHDKPEGDLAAALQGISAEGTVDAAYLKKLMNDVTSGTAAKNEVDMTGIISKPVSSLGSSKPNDGAEMLLNGVMYGASGQTSYYGSRDYVRTVSNVNSHNVTNYTIAGMTFTQEQADTMHVSDLFSLAIYANQNG